MDDFAFSVPRSHDAPYEARCLLGDHLEGLTPPDTNEVARLLVSELVTNCVRHAGLGAGDPIEVSGTLHGERLRVEVQSEGPAFEHTPSLPAPAAADGRGLYLVDTLADDWGARSAGAVTGVWFELHPAS